MHYSTPSGFIKCPKNNFSVRISAIVAFREDSDESRASNSNVTIVSLVDGEDYRLHVSPETLSDEINRYFKP